MQSYSDDDENVQSKGRDKRPRKTSRRRSGEKGSKDTTSYRMQDVAPLERATVDKAKVIYVNVI